MEQGVEEGKLQQAIVERMPIAALVFQLVDLDRAESLTLRYFNAAACRFLGHDLIAFVGKTIVDLFPAASETSRITRSARVAGTGQPETPEEGADELQSASDNRFSTSLVPLPEQSVCILLEDLSPHRRMTEELRIANTFLDSIIENLPAMVFVKDAEHLRFQRFNRAGEHLLGYSRAELMGKGDYDFFPPEQAAFFQAKDRETLERGVVLDIPEEPLETKQGTRWLHTKKIPIVDRHGEPQYLLGIAMDITERKRAADEVHRAREGLELRIQERTEALVAVNEQLRREAVSRREVELALKESEDRLRLAVASAKLGTFDFNIQSGALRWDERCKELFGLLPAAEVDYDVFLSRLHPDYRDQMHHVVQEAMNPEGTGTYDVEFKTVATHDGTERWIAAQGQCIFQEGRPVRLIGTVRDVTAQRNAEERVRESEAQYRFLAEASRSLAASLDLEQTLSTVASIAVPHVADWCAVDMVKDSGGVKRLAVAHLEPSRVPWADQSDALLHLDTLEPRGISHVLRSAKADLYRDDADEAWGSPSHERPKRMRESGLNSMMIVPLVGRDKVLGAITFVTAESGRRYTEEDLARGEELARRASTAIETALLFQEAGRERLRAEEANRIKDEFLATVSHELRTPLTAIMGWSAILRGARGGDPSRMSKGLGVIHRNAQAQTKIIDDILDVSRIITGKLRLEPRSMDLQTVVIEAIEVVRPSAAAKRIEFGLDLGSESCVLEGDPERLRQVAWNLLSNAVKFTPTGGQIFVRIQVGGESVRLKIEDTGQGITPEFLPHVFERFRQADGSTTRSHGGLGLGLAIVRHLVEMHGGKVSVTSAGLGKGATFEVELPIQTRTKTRKNIRDVVQDMDRSGSSIEGRRVLVVDDEEDARELIAAVLTSHGAITERAGSMHEAMGLVESFNPTVLVSDIGMPGQDGYDLIRKIRESEHSRAHLPAVAVTAYARPEDEKRALEAGYDAYLAKPIEPDALLATIGRL